MYKKYFPYFLLLTGLIISIVAAYYSVFGLSKLFQGAAVAIIILGSVLELAKVLIASALNSFWIDVSKSLRIYLIIAEIVLMLITSLGIYGFLTSAYQETYNSSQIETKQIELLEFKKSVFQESKSEIQKERSSVVNDISQLRVLLDSKNQQVDRKTGQIVTSSVSKTRDAALKQLEDATQRRDGLDIKLSSVNDSITKLEIDILNLKTTNSDATAKLGPLRYISKLTGSEIDYTINYLLLALIFVFDPLAIALILLSNSLLLRVEKSDVNTKPEVQNNKGPEPTENLDPETPVTGSNPIIINSTTFGGGLIGGNINQIRPKVQEKVDQEDMLAKLVTDQIKNKQ